MRNTDFTPFRQKQVILPGSVIHKRPDPATDAGKTQILAEAIRSAKAARGVVEIRDLTQAGVSKADAERLYDAALDRARRIDSTLFRAAA
jgi:hypothetical protein